MYENDTYYLPSNSSIPQLFGVCLLLLVFIHSLHLFSRIFGDCSTYSNDSFLFLISGPMNNYIALADFPFGNYIYFN